MKSPDLNVLVAAFRANHPHHRSARRWLVETLRSGEPLGVSAYVATGVIRLLTHPRMWPDGAESTEKALGHIDALLRNRAVTVISPGPRHWDIFAALCRDLKARGPFGSDVAHAAVAMEHGATWVTFDRDFASVPGLRWETPSIGGVDPGLGVGAPT